jgi:hypothetical protein
MNSSEIIEIQAKLSVYEHQLQSLVDLIAPLDYPIRGELFSLLFKVHQVCHDLGLSSALYKTEKLQELINPRIEGRVSSTDTQRSVYDLRENLQREIEKLSFIVVPKGDTTVLLFGQEVAQKFPRASFQISEAGKCLELERYTACVFHLMCVLEVGLDSLANELGLPMSRANWHNVLERIESSVRSMPNKDPGSMDRKQFLSEVALHFLFIKEAWRNHVAHGRARYSEEMAREVFGHVKSFMKHLATRLQERPES